MLTNILLEHLLRTLGFLFVVFQVKFYIKCPFSASRQYNVLRKSRKYQKLSYGMCSVKKVFLEIS